MSLKLFIQFYWKILFIIIYSIILLPIFLINDNLSNRCLYVILLMVGFWVTEALPLPVTGLIPVAFFPLMGILNSHLTNISYINEATILFLGGYMLALAIESSNLHLRISLNLIKMVGYGPKCLHAGFSMVTMFISMWISNTATTAIMIPIVHSTLKELEAHGYLKMYEGEGEEEILSDTEETVEPKGEYKRVPTSATMGFFLSIAYSATLGGTGFIIGAASNLEFKGIYETTYPNLKIDLGHWLVIWVLPMLSLTIFSIVYIQMIYLGLGRPDSKAAKELIREDRREIPKSYIVGRLEELGRITFHEIAVAFCFILAILLWIFREPQFMPGWADLWLPYNVNVKDATVAIGIIILLFLIPREPSFCFIFSKDEAKKPGKYSLGLLTWKVTLRKVPWGLFFLIGGGFAIAEGARYSGLSENITKQMGGLPYYGSMKIFYTSIFIAVVITQVVENVSAVAIVLPILADVVKAADLHPIFILMPTAIACSFSFLLPASTPPNAMVAQYINMPTKEMIKAGLVILIVAIINLGFFPVVFISMFYETGKFPLDAYMKLEEGI